MSNLTHHSTDDPDPGIHDATKALQDLANEVEQERVQRGRSALDPVVLSDGTELAEKIEHPGAASESDHRDPRETDPASVLPPVTTRANTMH